MVPCIQAGLPSLELQPLGRWLLADIQYQMHTVFWPLIADGMHEQVVQLKGLADCKWHDLAHPRAQWLIQPAQQPLVAAGHWTM